MVPPSGGLCDTTLPGDVCRTQKTSCVCIAGLYDTTFTEGKLFKRHRNLCCRHTIFSNRLRSWPNLFTVLYLPSNVSCSTSNGSSVDCSLDKLTYCASPLLSWRVHVEVVRVS